MFEYLLIDGNNFAWRAASVMHLTSRQGKNVSVAYGMLNMLHSLIEEHQPKIVCICWDFGGSKTKTDLYPEYKSNRKKSDLLDDLYKEIVIQINDFQNIIPYFGLKQIKRKGVEADDVIGLLCSSLKNVLVVSSDRDMFQVVNMGSSLFYPPKNVMVNKFNFEEITGINPENYIYYRSIVGDAGDCIPGLKWVGEVTAKKLITKYGPWINWFTNGNISPFIFEALNKRQRIIIQDPEVAKILIRNYYLMDIGRLDKEKEAEFVKELLGQKTKFDINFVKNYFLENQFDLFISKFGVWVHSFRNLK